MTNQTLLIEYAPRCPSPVLKFPDAHPCKGRDLLHHTNRPGSIHKIAENLRNNVNNPKCKFKVCVCVCVWGGLWCLTPLSSIVQLYRGGSLSCERVIFV